MSPSDVIQAFIDDDIFAEGMAAPVPTPEPMRILIVDGGRDMSGVAMRLAAGLRVMGGTVTIALHNEVPRDADVKASVDVERGAVTISDYSGELTVTAEARRVIQAIGRLNYGAVYGGLDLLPREPKRKAQWKQEVAGRPDQHRRTGKRR